MTYWLLFGVSSISMLILGVVAALTREWFLVGICVFGLCANAVSLKFRLAGK